MSPAMSMTRSRVAAEDFERGEAEFGEVDLVVFGEDDFEVGDGPAQDGEDVAEGGPLRVAVGVGREIANVAEDVEELRDLAQALEELEHGVFQAAFLARPAGKALALVHSSAPFIPGGKQEIADATPMLRGHGGGERRDAGEEADVVVALGGGVVGEVEELLFERGFRGEEAVRFSEDAVNLTTEGSFEVDAELLPVGLRSWRRKAGRRAASDRARAAYPR